MTGFKWGIPQGTKPAQCRGCGAEIFWIKTPRKKNLPCNPDGLAHWGTCPNADQFKREKGPDEQGRYTEEQIRTALRKGVRVFFEELDLKPKRSRK